jgi:ABC-type multidrug transport system ATPase subunit
LSHPPADPAIAIESQGLTKHYKNVMAVDDLRFQVPTGAICGFLGPNGAGKTTTIRMFLGLVRPSSGTGRVNGFDILTQRREVHRRIGAIVETPAFYGYLSARENLAVFVRSSSVPVRGGRSAELLELVGLAGRAKDRVSTYSLGMRQRLGIAAALLTDPEVLFLDEPTNGLDPAGTVEMRETITRLASDRRTILLSSHLLAEVEQVCSRVVIVARGKAVFAGDVQSLLNRGAAVVVETNQAAECAEVLARTGLHAEVDSGRVRVRARRSEVPQLVRTLVEAGVDVYAIREERDTLEEVFLDLTGTEGQP